VSLPDQTAFGEPLVSAQELAAALKVSRRTIYEWVEERELPCYRIGRSLLFEVSAVRRWLGGYRAGDWCSVCEFELRDREEFGAGNSLDSSGKLT
jgi:excisionase family DNA binding protein